VTHGVVVQLATDLLMIVIGMREWRRSVQPSLDAALPV